MYFQLPKTHLAYLIYIHLLFLSLLLSLAGGFQGIPSSLRQPGPRANLRHMSPGGGTQGPRGVFTITVAQNYHHLLILAFY